MRDRGLIGDVSQGLNAAVDTLLVLKTLLAATFEDTAELAKGIGEAAAKAPPSSVGFSVDAGSGFRAAIKGISETAATVVLHAKTLIEFAGNSVDDIDEFVVSPFRQILVSDSFDSASLLLYKSIHRIVSFWGSYKFSKNKTVRL